MKYSDGTTVKLGDKVVLASGDKGVVVFSIDTEEYSDSFPKRDWEYLDSGVMVKTEKGAFVHLVQSEESLIHRSK